MKLSERDAGRRGPFVDKSALLKMGYLDASSSLAMTSMTIAELWSREKASLRRGFRGRQKDLSPYLNAILPEAFARRVVEACETAKTKKIDFNIDVCLQATGKASPSSSPYVWLIVSWFDGQAFRFRAGRPMTISPREVLRPHRNAR
jgi:hypothetical protein